MSNLKPVALPKRDFDETKFQALTEPLTVRVEKMRNGGRTPIPLPESEDAPGQPGGVGYDKDAVRGLEQFLVTEWSGGGIYSIKLTDAGGQSMEWFATYPVGEYPERTPPPLRTAAAPPLATKRSTMGNAFPNGFPSFNSSYPQQPQYQQPQFQQPYPYAYPPLPPPPPVGTPGYSMWSQEADKRSESAELRALREENARRDRDAMQAKHQQELDRERQANEQRFGKQESAMADLRNMISSLATTIQQAAASAASAANAAPKQDPQLEALKLQLAASEKRDEEARRDRERRESQDLIKQMNDQSQRQIDAMARQLDAFQASLTSVNANRNDPMIEMLREQARQSAEMVKSISQNNASSIDKLQTTMLSPRDILALAKESSQAADQVTDKLTNTFSRVIDLQTKVTENALQLQPQGSPAVDMVRDGASHLKEMAERYLGGKELQQKLEQAKHEQLTNAQRDIEIAKINANAGLAGMAQQQQQPQVVYQAPETRKRKGKIDGAGPVKPAKRILGKTEMEWFGDALYDNVQRLRQGVGIFLHALKSGAEVMPEGAVSPENAAQGIAHVCGMIIAQGVHLPITDDLLFQHRYSDFMDVMIPNAPEQYKSDVLQILLPLLRGEVGGGEGMTGEEAPEPEDDAAEQDEADEGASDDEHDDGASADADADPDDREDGTQDGGNDVARGAQLAVVKDEPAPVAKPTANGRPINPPRRA